MIIKYDPTLSSDPYQSHEYAIMEEESHGEYVKYEDYQLLEAKIAELEKALDKIIDRAQKVDGWESFPESWIDEAYEALKEKG